MSGRVVTEKEFTLLKQLIDSGVSQNKFIETTGRGHATYSRIKHCATFDEYTNYIARSSGWKKEEKKPVKMSRRDEIMEHYTEIAHHLMLLGRLLGEE